MNEMLSNLIESLREELKEYGEMLALLEQEQQMVAHRQTHDLRQYIAAINTQSEAVAAARQEREQRQRHVARHLGLPDSDALSDLVPHLPVDYRPMLQALVQDNHESLTRIRQRARENQLLLDRIAELMQRSVSALAPDGQFPPAADAGAARPERSLCDPVG